MQILLTMAEYDDLRGQSVARARDGADKLQRVCTLAAEHVPCVTVSWGPWKEPPQPWGCILTPGSKTEYCDECPVRNECPSTEKQWSK